MDYKISEVKTPIIITKHNGSRLFGMFQRPVQEAFYPLVIFFHGFANNKCGSRNIHVKLAKKLSSKGIASLRVDLSGCGDSDGDIHQLSLDDFLDDSREIINYLPKLPNILKDSYSFFGSSLGGSIALLLAKEFPLSIKTIVTWAPIIKGDLFANDLLNKSKENGSSIDAVLSSLHGVTINKHLKMQVLNLNLISDIKNLSPHSSLFHLQAEFDPIVSISHQDEILKTLKDSPCLYQCASYPFDDHSLGGIPDHNLILNDIVNWFEKILIPKNI